MASGCRSLQGFARTTHRQRVPPHKALDSPLYLAAPRVGRLPLDGDAVNVRSIGGEGNFDPRPLSVDAQLREQFSRKRWARDD